ncbi:hypothetical protein QO009_002992 [Brevibacillus aydinogluensis]|jgi:hypothetical protein|uniref:hypothetical protein n=1 Tax=Brevibacillus aydinogluensis TaxID=927786 RepID=UPI002892E2AF|nr:hypothetical protein [Brevibacillus aydinogluensis]MDT3417097.1 hypothetical protein [Brevibacillus aydinogluensis]
MQPYKGRSVENGQQVNVYVNLNNQGLFSIQCCKTKLVLAHAEVVWLENCRFFVSESGRMRSVAKQVRSVHAWLTGTFVSADKVLPTPTDTVVSYNPFSSSHFYNILDNSRVVDTDIAICYQRRVYCYQKPVKEESFEQCNLFGTAYEHRYVMLREKAIVV